MWSDLGGTLAFLIPLAILFMAGAWWLINIRD